MLQNLAVAFSALEIISLALQFIHLPNEADEFVATASLDALAAFTLVAIYYVEHHRDILVPGPLTLYLFISLFVDITKSVSFYHHNLYDVSAVVVASGITRLALLVLEQLSRWGFCSIASDPSQANSSSRIPLSTFFYFMNPLLLLLRPHKDLEGLKPPAADLSHKTYLELEQNWRAAGQTADNSLLLACIHSFKGDILLGFVFCTLAACFSSAEVFVLHHIIVGSSLQETWASEKVSCLAVFLAVYLGKMFSRLGFSQFQLSVEMKLRSGLLGLSFRQIERLTLSEAQRSTVVSFVSADIDDLLSRICFSYTAVLSLLEVVLRVYFLYVFIGLPAFAVFISVLLTIIFRHSFEPYTVHLWDTWKREAKRRLERTESILPQLRALRIIGLGPSAADTLEQFRGTEIDAHIRYDHCLVINSVVSIVLNIFTPMLVLSIAFLFNAFGSTLPAATIFPALSLICTAKDECLSFAKSCAGSRGILSGFGRIQGFLLQSEGREEVILPQAMQTGQHDQHMIISAERPRATSPRTSRNSAQLTTRRANSTTQVFSWTDSKVRALFTKPGGLRSIYLLCLALFISVIAELLPDMYLCYWVQRYPTSTTHYVGYVLATVAPIPLHAFCTWFQLEKLWPEACTLIHRQVLNTTLRATLESPSKAEYGSILERFGSNMDHFTDDLGYCMLMVAYVSFRIFASCCIIFSGSLYLSMALPPVLLALVFLVRTHIRFSGRCREIDSKNKFHLLESFRDPSSGLRYIRALGWQTGGEITTSEIMHKILEGSQISFFYQLYATHLAEQSASLLFCFIGAIVIMTANSSGAAVSLAALHLYRVTPIVSLLFPYLHKLGTAMEGLSSDSAFIHLTPKEKDRGRFIPPISWPTEGKVEFKEVAAKYRSVQIATLSLQATC